MSRSAGDVKTKVSREECESLSVVDLARERLLAPGPHAGFVGILDFRTHEIASWLPVRTEIEGSEGVLRVFEPFEQSVRLEARPVKIRPGRHWMFQCFGPRGTGGCGRLVRRLYRPCPEGDQLRRLFSLWACRHCHGVAFPRYRAETSALRDVAELRRIIAEAERLIEIIEGGAVLEGGAQR